MAATSISLLAALFGVCKCRGFFDCTLPIDSNGGVFVWLALMVYMLRTLSTICDSYFVPSLEAIVDRLQMNQNLASVTFLALGSVAPRVWVSLVATFLIVNTSGVGAIVGSGIFNVLVIQGMTGLVACREHHSLRIYWYPLMRDAIFYLIALLELLLILSDEIVEWYEGLILLGTYVLYGLWMRFGQGLLRSGQRFAKRTVAAAGARASTKVVGEEEAGIAAEEIAPTTEDDELAHAAAGDEAGAGDDAEAGAAGGSEGEAAADGAGEPAPEVTLYAPASAAVEEVLPEDPPATFAASLRDPLTWLLEALMPDAEERCWLLFWLSLLCVGFASYAVVDCADRAGRILNLPSTAMGLTALAVGTSVPDALGSIAVAKQGEGDLAVANALSAGVFDVVVGLGLPWTLRCIGGGTISFEGEFAALTWDIGLLMAFVVLLIAMILQHKRRLTRRVSTLLLILYAIYCLFTFVGLFTLRSRA